MLLICGTIIVLPLSPEFTNIVFFYFTVTKFIRIGIADKNDNPPYFDKALYEAEVDENEDIQHTVLTVTAKDHDECEYLCFVHCNHINHKQDLGFVLIICKFGHFKIALQTRSLKMFILPILMLEFIKNYLKASATFG